MATRGSRDACAPPTQLQTPPMQTPLPTFFTNAIQTGDPNAAPVAVDAPAPELPEDSNELGDATREVVRQLCSSNDEVRALLGGS